jgi:hypothetical protein
MEPINADEWFAGVEEAAKVPLRQTRRSWFYAVRNLAHKSKDGHAMEMLNVVYRRTIMNDRANIVVRMAQEESFIFKGYVTAHKDALMQAVAGQDV